MVTINPDRVLGDLYHLRSIGEYKTGVHRPTLSSEDMETKRWLVAQLEALGHEVTIDGISNVVSKSPGTGPKLLAGSHLETQNHAGWLDGALGVIYALEAARAVAEDPDMTGKGVDVISFADEEGHFGDLLGSRSFTGALPEQEIDAARDDVRDLRLRAALETAGLAHEPRLTFEPGRHAGFLEAHIEQGDWLESNALKIGIVTSIVAIWQYRIAFEGVQNHAGTTRMAIRKDAGAALRALCARIDERFAEAAAPRSVWTVGRMTVEPGDASIIPGRAEMLFQLRDADPKVLDRLEGELTAIVADANEHGPCKVTMEHMGKGKPALMNDRFQDAIEAAAEEHAAGNHTRMPSGASHDAQVMATQMPAGMLFVPSIGGISHHYVENTSDEDIVLGAQVYATAARNILNA